MDDFGMGYALGSESNDGRRDGGMGWGDGSWLWILVIFALLGWGNNGFGGGFGNGNGAGYIASAATQADIQRGFDTQSIINKLDGINSGLCDGFYAVNTSLLNGFNGVDNAVCNLGYQTAQLANGLNTTMMQGFSAANVVALQNQNALSAQLASCCCDQRVGQMQLQNAMDSNFCTTNYNAATNTTAIIQNAHNDTDRVLAKLDAMEMARKDETIASLRSQLAACGDQNTAQYIINQLTGVISPRAVPAYPAASPCGLGNWSSNVLANSQYYNGGCGCNSGCCGCNG